MGSLNPQLSGAFSLFDVASGIDDNDPWERPYLTTPSFKKFVNKSFPLIDIRPDISDPKYKPADLLRSHGFGVVRHKSALFEASPDVAKSIDDVQLLNDVYYPEIRDIVRQATRAKHIFVTHSFIRSSRPPGSSPPLPSSTSQGPLNPANRLPRCDTTITPNSQSAAKFPGTVNRTANAANRSNHIPAKANVGPARLPHLDFTALGARQSIRSWRRDIAHQAAENGIIEAEDLICKDFPFPATTSESNAVIAEQYNRDGLGPRYAAYSLWRPVRTVQRDPLCIAPRRGEDTGDLVGWPYDIKIPGHTDLGGDFVREVALLGVGGESATLERGVDAGELKWYYMSQQTREEVLIIKFFDSAALGREGEEAPAPWHGSPEVGLAAGEAGRESIEVRVFAFW